MQSQRVYFRSELAARRYAAQIGCRVRMDHRVWVVKTPKYEGTEQ
jgi:hypothetical protein